MEHSQISNKKKQKDKKKATSLTAKRSNGDLKSSAKFGLSFQRRFTHPAMPVSEMFDFVERTSKITNPDGSVVFEMPDAEVPSTWSQLATDIAVSKYFRKAGVPGTKSEKSVKQLVFRIAHTIREHGEANDYFASKEDADSFEAELSFLLFTQRAAFNSPVWFNVGLYHRYGILGTGGNYYWNEHSQSIEKTADSYSHPQASACFIQSVEDDLLSIFELAKNEAKIFKYGSGTGSNFSKIRGAMEKLAGGGTSSGLMSFLEVLDRGAGATKSGGTTRRAAKMVTLDIDHPEVLDFITWKVREERKVAALVDAGYSSDFNGDAYRTVAGQNSNNSVRLSDEFMKAVIADGSWSTKLRTTGETFQTFRARELFDEIASAAWHCADPGVQYDSTINDFHTCPSTDRINGSNPCSEYMFLDDSACNLASINLMKYMDESTGEFQIEAFRDACRVMFTAQEILVGLSSYPTAKIAKNSHDYRPLGLGYANLGTLLMVNGVPYDSDAGRGWCGAITAILHGEAYATSAEIAKVKGAFTGYAKNKKPMLAVMQKHLAATKKIVPACPEYLRLAAEESMEKALTLGQANGYRNAQATVLAPTGTIGLLMDCDTTGIEPDFALVKYKKLAGGGYFKIVNQSVTKALARLGYSANEITEMQNYLVGTLNLRGVPHINRESLLAKGLTESDLEKVETSLPNTFDFPQAFNRYTISEETFRKLRINEEQSTDANFSFLRAIGFSAEQIEEAGAVVCGRMTLEGCTLLKKEHLPVFDCANPCGKTGKRFLAAMSHIKMMAAAQPFISGAISKTVNLPHEATPDDIKSIYLEAWKLGLKAVAIYRDGSKLSQPLSHKVKNSSKAEPKLPASVADLDMSLVNMEEISDLISRAQIRAEELAVRPNITRRRLPKKRKGFTIEAKIAGHKIYCRTGEYEDGSLGEIFIDMHKEGAAFRSLLNCFAISVSMGLQYGVPLEEYVKVFTFTKFEPHGMVDHENIKSATSVVDFIFRVLGMEYLGRTDFVHVKPNYSKQVTSSSAKDAKVVAGDSKATVSTEVDTSEEMLDGANQHLASMMGEAPPCNDCGHITVRNGTCYRCMNCGNSMGCS